MVHTYLKKYGTKLKYNRNKGVLQIKDELTDAKEEKEESENTNNQIDENEASKKRLGVVTDEDLIKLRKGEKKKIDWKNKLYLGN